MRVLNLLAQKHTHLKPYFNVIKRSFLTASLPELSEFPKRINNPESLYKFSIENRELFWSTIAKRRINWFKEFTQVTSGSFDDENFRLKWFADGKLNVSGKNMLLFSIEMNYLALVLNLRSNYTF